MYLGKSFRFTFQDNLLFFVYQECPCLSTYVDNSLGKKVLAQDEKNQIGFTYLKVHNTIV